MNKPVSKPGLSSLLLVGTVFLVSVFCAVFLYSKNLSNNQSPIDENNLNVGFDFSQKEAEFHSNKIQIPDNSVTKTKETADIEVTASNDVLGSKKSEKRIEVDLTNQKLYAFEGNKKKYSFPISSGKWYPTPTGEFRIWSKIKYTLMTGGSKALGTYYYLPNVPYTMFFYNNDVPKWKGFGIHGTYWHNNFGHPMSHGCVNMNTDDAKTLFYWANPPIGPEQASIRVEGNEGTKVIIYGTAPKE